MRVENNDEVDILNRLGILEREISSNHISTKIIKNRYINNKSKFNVALNRISLNDSSTDEDSDFINKKSTNEIKAQKNIFDSQEKNCHSNPNFYEFLSFLSVAGFLSFSFSLKEFSDHQNFGGIRVIINFIFTLLGTYFAAFSLFIFHLNSFFVLLILMFTFIAFFGLSLININNNSIFDMSFLNIILFNATQSFLTASIERVILLIIPFWNANFRRIIFIVYTFITFCVFLSFTIQYQLLGKSILNISQISKEQVIPYNGSKIVEEEFIKSKNPLLIIFDPQIFILFIFTLPILFGFCCFFGRPLGSIQQHISSNGYFIELQNCNNSSTSYFSYFLLFSVMVLHFTSFIIAKNYINFYNEDINKNAQNLFFWLFLFIYRLPFAIWPNISICTKLFYLLYFILITASVLVKFILPENEHFNILNLAILSFSSNFPLLLYVWYINYTKCSHLNISFCFILSLSFAELIGKSTLFLTENISSSFKIGIFSMTFSLFLILIYKLQKEERQRQIIEYSSSINGKNILQNSSRFKKKLNKKVKTSKGAYSLLEMSGRRTAKKINTKKQCQTIISNCDRSSFDSDEDEADVEMESVTGGDDELEKEECTRKNEFERLIM